MSNQSLSNKLYLKKQLYRLRRKQETAVLEHLNFFNKIISELLAVDVKINKEDKVLILLSSLSKSYDHIVTTMLYGKETLILEEVMATLLSIRIRRRPNQDVQKGSSLVVMVSKGREEKKSLGPGSSKTYHFYHKEGHWKKDYKHRQEWLKKKGRTTRQMKHRVYQTPMY